MRGTKLLAASILLLAACGGDDVGGDVGDALSDDPTPEECLDLSRTVFDRFEVPEDVDPSDGLDDVEGEAVDAAMEVAAEGEFDILDDDHPCVAALDLLSAEEWAAFAEELDPQVLAILTAPRVEFEAIEDEL